LSEKRSNYKLYDQKRYDGAFVPLEKCWAPISGRQLVISRLLANFIFYFSQNINNRNLDIGN